MGTYVNSSRDNFSSDTEMKLMNLDDRLINQMNEVLQDDAFDNAEMFFKEALTRLAVLYSGEFGPSGDLAATVAGRLLMDDVQDEHQGQIDEEDEDEDED